jgi:UDP-N-acetylmuramate--alanine ligase
VASVLAAGGLDPTFVIGGRLNAPAPTRGWHRRLHRRRGRRVGRVVPEPVPVIEVITNIDADHMDTYGHDFARLKQAFVEFTQRLPFYGAPCCASTIRTCARSCRSSEAGRALRLRPTRRCARRTSRARRPMHFTVMREGRSPLAVVLNLPGLHNVQNALAAIAIATDLGVPDDAIQAAGRIQRRGPALPALRRGAERGRRQFTLIDDYGHHPVEMAATLAAARGVPGPPPGAGVPAAPLHAHARLLRGFRQGAVDGRRAAADGGLCGRRGADRAADGRALSRALRVVGKVDPVFVETVDDMPDAWPRSRATATW